MRKLSNECNEEMLVNEHARGRQAQDTSTKMPTSD